MIFEVRLPLIMPQMSAATVECLYVEPGEAVKMGSKLADLRVDLSSAFAQECPPVSYYRIVLRERAFVRSISATPGDLLEVDAPFVLFSTDPDEPLDPPATRPMRTTIAGIMHHDGMVSDQKL